MLGNIISIIIGLGVALSIVGGIIWAISFVIFAIKELINDKIMDKKRRKLEVELKAAIEREDKQTVENILKKDNITNFHIDTAVEWGDKEIVSLLLNKIGSINNYDGNILITAVKKDDKEMVSLLVQKGADVNKLYEGKPPLDYAKNEEVIALLKNHGAKTKAEMDEEYRKKMEEEQRKLMASNDLLVAVVKQDIARVLSCIELGADVNYSDLTGSSPLVFAVKSENMEIIQILLKNGANPMQENDVIGGGKTCAVWTARYNLKNERLATFLEDYYYYS